MCIVPSWILSWVCGILAFGPHLQVVKSEQVTKLDARKLPDLCEVRLDTDGANFASRSGCQAEPERPARI